MHAYQAHPHDSAVQILLYPPDILSPIFCYAHVSPDPVDVVHGACGRRRAVPRKWWSRPCWAQSYQGGDVAKSPPRPHFMSPRPHSEGLLHSDADGVQNWPKCEARNLWKLNSHLVLNCNSRMGRMLFSVCFIAVQVTSLKIVSECFS